jgi:hypothetical protein
MRWRSLVFNHRCAFLRLVASALLLKTLVMVIMKEHDPNDTRDDPALTAVSRTSWCLVVFALVDLTKTLGCRLLSLRVNSESLFDLLKVLDLQHIWMFPSTISLACSCAV